MWFWQLKSAAASARCGPTCRPRGSKKPSPASTSDIKSVVSNETPKEFSEIIKSALDEDFKRARQLHYQLLDLMNVNFIESNPIPVKTALFMMGKIEESFRLPLVKMSDKNKEVLIQVLKKGRWIK